MWRNNFGELWENGVEVAQCAAVKRNSSVRNLVCEKEKSNICNTIVIWHCLLHIQVLYYTAWDLSRTLSSSWGTTGCLTESVYSWLVTCLLVICVVSWFPCFGNCCPVLYHVSPVISVWCFCGFSVINIVLFCGIYWHGLLYGSCTFLHRNIQVQFFFHKIL